MRLKLRLSHKGFILVASLLTVELFLLGSLWFVLREAEEAQSRALRSEKITAQANNVLFLFYRAAGAMIKFTFRPTGDVDLEGISKEFSTEWNQLKQLVADDPSASRYVQDMDLPMKRAFDILDKAPSIIKDNGRFGSFRTIASPAELNAILSNSVVNLKKLRWYEEGLSKSATEATDTRRGQETALIFAIIINIALAFWVGGYVFFGSLIRRIERLAQNTMRLASGERLMERDEGSDEISNLDSMFHRMATELDRAVQTERAIIENALDVICTIDENGKFMKMSPACEPLWGYAPADLLGMRVSALIAPDDLERTNGVFSDTIRGGGQASFENRVKRKDGSEADMLWSMRWYAPERILLCICHDISQRKEIERLRREFVSMVSHDLKTPLSSVSTSIALVQAGVYGKLDNRGQNILQQTEEEIERLIQLIGGLLDVARMEAGKMELDIEECHLAEVITRSINAVKGFAEKKNITLVGDPTKLKILADGARITQVIVNLLSNGVKFSGANTQVRVCAEQRDDVTEIRICDQGPGVPPDQRALIFERFERAGNKRSGVEGTGLGLAICKTIVDAHHGSIGVGENPGGGAVFWFCIPRVPVEVSAKK